MWFKQESRGVKRGVIRKEQEENYERRSRRKRRKRMGKKKKKKNGKCMLSRGISFFILLSSINLGLLDTLISGF